MAIALANKIKMKILNVYVKNLESRDQENVTADCIKKQNYKETINGRT